jgi:uncharacterized membrane protein YgaE (UPF0421/DUF939 family)
MITQLLVAREEIEHLAKLLRAASAYYALNGVSATLIDDASEILLALLDRAEAAENIAEQTQAARVKDIEETIPALEAALSAEREKVDEWKQKAESAAQMQRAVSARSHGGTLSRFSLISPKTHIAEWS